MKRIFLGAALAAALAFPSLAQTYHDTGGSVVPAIVPITPNVGPLFTVSNPGQVAGTFSASFSGFQPTPAYSQLAVGASSARVALPAGTVVVVYNTGANAAFVTLGNASVVATAADDVIQPNSWMAFTVGSAVDLAAIETAGATALNISGGAGLPTGAGGGGGGGSGSNASVGATGAAVPGSGTYAAMNVGGNLTGMAGTANGLKVDGSAVTQPVSGTFWQATQPVSGTVAATGATSNASSAVATSGANIPVVSWAYGFNGTTWDQLQVDGSKNLKINCTVGCAGGAFNNNSDAVATSSTNGQAAAWLYAFNGATWDRLEDDGSKNLKVNCVTGCSGGAGGTSATDAATYTQGSGGSSYTPIGGEYNTAITNLASGQGGALQVTPQRFALAVPGTTTNTGTAWNSGTSANTTQTLVNGAEAANAYLVQLDQTPTLTAGAVNFQVSGDGTNWTTINPYQVVDPTSASGAQISLPYTLQASANKQFLIYPNGMAVRMILSTAITGTGAITPYVTPIPSSVSTALLPGANTLGKIDILGNAGAVIDATVAAGPAPANGVAALGQYLSSAPSPSNGQTVALQVTSAGSLHTTVDNSNANGQATMSASSPVVLASNQSVADPCMFQAKTNLPLSFNGTALNQIIAASGSTKIYICSISIIAAGATALNLNTGTGSNCATGTAALIGSTTAANGMSLAANGGFTLGNGGSTVAVTAASSELCTLQSNAVYAAGNLTYVQQ